MLGVFMINEAGEVRPAEAFESPFALPMKWRRLGYDQVGPWTISTVFLGMDHNFSLGLPVPILWETMLFPQTEVVARYATREEAVDGHWSVVLGLSAYQATHFLLKAGDDRSLGRPAPGRLGLSE